MSDASSARPSPSAGSGPASGRAGTRGPWRRYVAIGDSFTEGMCDPDPDVADEFIGWADRLAVMLARVAGSRGEDFGYANLAIRGRLLDDVVERQLPLALDLRPDLISIVGGANDIMRPRVDLTQIAARLERAVVTAREAGADVLLATPTDPAGAPIIGRLRPRHAIHTANVWTIARRYGAHVIDQWGFRALQDWRMWAQDRIHMTREGHERVAMAAYAALGLTPDDLAAREWETPLPPRDAPSRAQWARENREWAREFLGPWIGRRLRGRSSGDARQAKRPELTPIDLAD